MKYFWIILALLFVIGGYFAYSSYNYFSSLSIEELNERQEELSTKEKPIGGMLSKKIIGEYNGYVIEEVYVCFGDVCPDNGGYYLRYKDIKSQEECTNIGGYPILGISWGVVYGGCGVVELTYSKPDIVDDNTPDDVVLAKLQVCPDEWIENRMPVSIPQSGEVSEIKILDYFILNGDRREFHEFDVRWIENNCEIEKSTVF